MATVVIHYSSEEPEAVPKDGFPVKSPPSSLEDPDHVIPVQECGVAVAVRVRPLSTAELANSSIGNCIQCLKDSIVVGASSTANPQGKGRATTSLKPRQFQVDTVFHQHATQTELYERSCRHIVEGLFDGINGAILAYGATGSGKTHTMFGGAMSSAGVVYQAVRDIFDEKTILEEEEGKTVEIKCSFVEIYNENVFDLLSPPKRPMHARTLSATSSSLEPQQSPNVIPELKNVQWVNRRPALPVRDGGKGTEKDSCNPETLHIPGLTYAYPNSAEDFSRAIEVGRSNRFVACTAANAQSSRSHAIITVEVHVSGGLDERGKPCTGTVARIRMCDLAGSERAASSSNSGIRLREGGNINRSLLALGAVVQSLLQRKSNPSGKVFVPYRGSCLTRLLKDSLGGNCRTQMIFCLNPSTLQQEECINTMLFAMKARQIQVAARRNEFNVNSEVVAKDQEMIIDELRHQISLYQEELERLGVCHSNNFNNFGSSRKGSRLRRQEDSQETSVDLGPFTYADQLNVHNTSVLSSSLDAPPEPMERKFSVSSLALDTMARDSSPAPLKTTGLRHRKATLSSEVSPHFAEMEKNLKALVAEKESQYWKNREAKERLVARDLQLRELQWKLARFLASNELGVRLRGDPATTSGGTVPTPVGVAGMRNTIAAVEQEQVQETSDFESMIGELDRIDRQIEKIGSEVGREKHRAVFELLLDNMKLRQNCTEAEHLASDYHQDCRQTKGRIAEYQEALSVCVSALHSVMPHLPHNSTAMADAKLALFYANLPHAQTRDMIRVFENSLKADSTPPLVPAPNLSSSPGKRHQRSHSDEELLETIQELEDSFHSLLTSPALRHGSRSPNTSLTEAFPHMLQSPTMEGSDEKRHTPGKKKKAEAPLKVTVEALSREHPALESYKEAEVDVGHPREKLHEPDGEGTPLATPPTDSDEMKRHSRSNQQINKTDLSPGKKPRAHIPKLAPFTRFYSTNTHLGTLPTSGATHVTTTAPLQRPSSTTPTRRRREVESSGSPSAANPTFPGGTSPLRSLNPVDTAANRRAGGQPVPSSRLGVRHGVRGLPGSLPVTALVAESPPKRIWPAQVGAHRTKESSSPVAGRGAASKEGPKLKTREAATASKTLTRSVSLPLRVKPATLVLACPPTASHPPQCGTGAVPVLAKRVVKTPGMSRAPKEPSPHPAQKSLVSINSSASPLVHVDVSPMSTVSHLTPRATPAPFSPQLLDTPVVSMLSVEDDMQVSRSTFSEPDEMELSSTISQFTPRDAQWIFTS